MNGLEERLAAALMLAAGEFESIEATPMPCDSPQCSGRMVVLPEVKAAVNAVLEEVRRARILDGQPELDYPMAEGLLA